MRLIWDQKYLAIEEKDLSERPRAATKMAAGPVSERNQDATIYVGGLDEKVNEALLWELFVQVISSRRHGWYAFRIVNSIEIEQF